MSQLNDENLIWIDLEMTGLDPLSDRIIEIATIVTDKNLNVLDKGPSVVVHQSDEMLDGMDEWCTNQHGKTGLTDRVRNSSISEETAENLTLAFLKQYISELLPNIAPYVDEFNHDLCDAAIAAFTAFLHEQHKTEQYGKAEEGVICLPLLDRMVHTD